MGILLMGFGKGANLVPVTAQTVLAALGNLDNPEQLHPQ
jgi:hypothetical protein